MHKNSTQKKWELLIPDSETIALTYQWTQKVQSAFPGAGPLTLSYFKIASRYPNPTTQKFKVVLKLNSPFSVLLEAKSGDLFSAVSSVFSQLDHVLEQILQSIPNQERHQKISMISTPHLVH